MKGRFFKVICAVVMSIGLFGQANASLIPGGIYQDVDGLEWEYVGSFDLADGPSFKDPVPFTYNGLAAAAFAIYADVNVPDTLALAAYLDDFDVDTISIGDNVVNHLAWYDSYYGPDINDIERLAEGTTAEGGGDAGKYDAIGDVSAYVKDRALPDFYTNYVFKAVEVPGPSTLGIFALALLGLGVRKLKR
jgi:hypothetical protein